MKESLHSTSINPKLSKHINFQSNYSPTPYDSSLIGVTMEKSMFMNPSGSQQRHIELKKSKYLSEQSLDSKCSPRTEEILKNAKTSHFLSNSSSHQILHNINQELNQALDQTNKITNTPSLNQSYYTGHHSQSYGNIPKYPVYQKPVNSTFNIANLTSD